MGRPPKSARTLSRDEVLTVALRLLDAGGDRALSFRSLAKQLGVTAMAVSHHVGSRQEMMRSLVERVYSGVATQPPAGTADEQIRFLLSRYCHRVTRHPNLSRSILADPSLSSGQLTKLTEQIRALLVCLCPNKPEADSILRLLIDFTHGFTFSVSSAPEGQSTTPEQMLADYLESVVWVLARAGKGSITTPSQA